MQVGGFSLVRQIGRGGMGVVYRARQHSLNRDVAVKLLLRRNMSEEFIRRFQREGQIAARMHHNHLVAVIEIGEAEGWHYIAMEYVDGPTLTQRIAADGPLSEVEVVTMGAKVASALQHAHENGIIHRDVKPGNIMFTRSGDPKLCDMGLAQHKGLDESDMIARGVTVGSRRYMAPEQVRGLENVDQRTDIYALGLTLFYALTGNLPFKGVDKDRVIYEHLRGHMHWPGSEGVQVSDEVSWVVMRMCAPDPNDRYQTAADLTAALEALRSDLVRRNRPTQTPAPTPSPEGGASPPTTQ
jgi:serine/threonine-protein kinase